MTHDAGMISEWRSVMWTAGRNKQLKQTVRIVLLLSIALGAVLCVVELARVSNNPYLCWDNIKGVDRNVVRGLLCMEFSLMTAGVFVWLNRFHNWHRFSASAFFVALLLVFWGITGYCIDTTAGERFFISNSRGVVYRFLLYLALTVVAYTLIVTFYGRLDAARRKSCEASAPCRLYAVVAFFTILLCWMPFLIGNYPGSVAYDSLSQLKQFDGVTKLDASNPVLVTVIFGSLFRVGRALGNDNTGVFLIVAFQTGLCAFAMAQMCKYIYQSTSSKKLYGLAVGFYALVPIWGGASQTVLKDVVHLGFFLLFLQYMARIVFAPDSFPCNIKGCIAKLIIFACLTGLSRKAAEAIVILSMVAVYLYLRKQAPDRKALLGKSVLCVCGVFLAFNIFISCAPDVQSPAEKENYSLPFQQIARYCKQYGDEMSEEEIAIVDQVLDFEVIITEYDPSSSDPVKATFHSTASEMHEFWKQYVRLGFKHPDVYLKHILNGVYKYFYPFSSGNCAYRHYIALDKTNVSGEPYYDAYYVNETAMNSLASYFAQWENELLLNLLIGPGLYMWLFILCFGYACKTRSVSALTLFTSIVVLLIGLFFSHINGENRYAYPLMASIPFCFALVLSAPSVKKKSTADLVNKIRSALGNQLFRDSALNGLHNPDN